MTNQDIENWEPEELQALDESFDSDGPYRRVRNAMLGAFLVLGVLAVLLQIEATAGAIAWTFGAYLAVTTLEKIFYARAQIHSGSTVRRLVRRLESVEEVPLTPDNGRPSVKARLTSVA